MTDRLRIVRRQGDVDEIRYKKSDDQQYYRHVTEKPTDLFLVDVAGKRGSLLLPRDDAHGWEKIDGKYWLTNAPRRSRKGKTTMAKRSTRKSAKHSRRGTARRAPHKAVASKKKRRPPAGFSTWSAYMASIRPTPRPASRSAGTSTTEGTMAKKKRRGRSTAKRHHAANPATRRRRRTYRRNPPAGGGRRGLVGSVVGLAKDGIIGGATVVAGEVAPRLVTNMIGMTVPGTATSTTATAAQAGISLAGGMVLEKMFGRQVGRDFVVGGMAGIIRATARGLLGTSLPGVAAALSGEGPRILLPRAGMAGYPPTRTLAGYPATNTALAGEYENEYEY